MRARRWTRAAPCRRCEGFSLAEVLVASAILAAGVLSLAQLFVLATRSNLEAMHATRAVLLAHQKIEELRACCATRVPVASPALSLHGDMAGYVDYVDRHGRTIDGGPPAPHDTVYTRRWSIVPLPSHPGGASVLQVVVTPHRAPLRDDAAPGQRAGEAWLVTLHTRRAP